MTSWWLVVILLQLIGMTKTGASCSSPAPGDEDRLKCGYRGEVAVVDRFSLSELPPNPCIVRPGLLGSAKLASLTPELISEKEGYLRPAAKRSAGRVIYYADRNKAFFRRGLVQLEDVVYDTEMTPAQFFSSLEQNQRDSYRYYASRLLDLGDKELVQEADRFAVPGSSGNQTNVWMGGNGVTAQAHYDADYNLFHQIYGHKTFLLFRPEAANSLHLFPFLHPYTRQSQFNFSSDASSFSSSSASSSSPNSFDLAAVPCWTASLQPGDSLYLPPFFFHHVTAVDTSISVNTWSSEVLPASRQLKLSLPFGHNATETMALLEHFRSALLPCLDAVALLRSRYTPPIIELLRLETERAAGGSSEAGLASPTPYTTKPTEVNAQGESPTPTQPNTEPSSNPDPGGTLPCPAAGEAATWKREKASAAAERFCTAYGQLPPGARDILATDALETLLLEHLLFPGLWPYFSRCLLR